MAQLTVPSQTPISIIKNGVTQVYDKWRASNVNIRLNPVQGAALLIQFQLCGLAQDGVTLIDYEGIGGVASYGVDNVLADTNLVTSATSFFTAVTTEAFQAGVLT